MVFSYKSIVAPCEGLYKEKGSKFHAYAFPVVNEEEIKQHLNELRKKHFDARHHCYAFRLGPDGSHYRANDDQEPSGTAGKPIHGQLLSFGLTNILLVVVRYFGGTKLGASGLINAYKSAAEDALKQCVVVEHDVMKAIALEFPYEHYNDVMRLVRETHSKIINQQLEEPSRIQLEIPLKNVQTLHDRCDRIHQIKFIEEQ